MEVVFTKLDLSSCIISTANTTFKKNGALIRSLKLLSPVVALYLYKCPMWPCMEFYHTALHGILLSCLGFCS